MKRICYDTQKLIKLSLSTHFRKNNYQVTYHTKNVNIGFRAYNYTLIGYQSNITIFTFAKTIFTVSSLLKHLQQSLDTTKLKITFLISI